MKKEIVSRTAASLAALLAMTLITALFTGCPNPASPEDDELPLSGVKSGQELQAALEDPAVTEITIAASFLSNVSAIVTTPKTITVPVGYRVVIEALQVNADVAITNSGSPPDNPGDLTKAGVLIIASKFMICEDAEFSVKGAAELAFMPEVGAGDAWIDGSLSAGSAGSVYRVQADGSSTGLTFSGEGDIMLGEEEGEDAKKITVEAVSIAGAPKGSITEASNADPVQAIMTTPAAACPTGGTGTISVSWNPVPGAAAYGVYYDTTENFESPSKFGEDVPETSATITGLEDDTTYYVRIKAVIGSWASGFSPSASAQTNFVPAYSIALFDGETELNAESGVDLGVQAFNYDPAPSRTITVKNTGTGATGELAAALSGEHRDSFTITGSLISGIDPYAESSFTVAAVSGLKAGVYTAHVAVTGGNSLSAGFGITFEVNDNRVSGSVAISYSDSFGNNPEVSYSEEIELNDAGEIPLTWSQAISIDTGTEYFKTVFIDGKKAATLVETESDYEFKPGEGDSWEDYLAPGPHTVTVFFSKTEEGAFIASAELKFRISKN
jgi:hypothetical protein